ncbi:MAG TPA: NBR1-Ig-like domain-containing protein [Anaerolineales bacterium]|nr:NBR1-Ig-like domain-containing protein [Anaerolineales bacterium]
MKLNTNSILILFGVVAFVIMACFPVTLFAMPLLEPSRSNANNASATVQAIVTQTMAAVTQTAPTFTPVPATATPVPPTRTPVPTAVSYCDWAMFIRDVTIPDGTILSPGEVFTKTWRLQNRGTCQWTPDYMLVYTGGDPMGSTTAVRLPGYVGPGQTVDVSVTLTGPASAGSYTGYWMLRNPSGALFGVGSKANEAFYVVIRTKENLPYGTVTGKLSFPSEFIPAMRVVLFSLKDGKAYFVDTARGQGAYSINVPTGTYYVVSYPYEGTPGHTGQVDSYTLGGGPFAGGYTKMVPCGLTVGCEDHTLLSVAIAAGQTVAADPGDWYASVGTFPQMPNP